MNRILFASKIAGRLIACWWLKNYSSCVREMQPIIEQSQRIRSRPGMSEHLTCAKDRIPNPKQPIGLVSPCSENLPSTVGTMQSIAPVRKLGSKIASLPVSYPLSLLLNLNESIKH